MLAATFDFSDTDGLHMTFVFCNHLWRRCRTMADSGFVLEVHHGGYFVGLPKLYLSGKVDFIRNVDSDLMSYFEVLDLVKGLGCNLEICNIFHKMPDSDFDGGLRDIKADTDVVDMFAIHKGRGIISVYVENIGVSLDVDELGIVRDEEEEDSESDKDGSECSERSVNLSDIEYFADGDEIVDCTALVSKGSAIRNLEVGDGSGGSGTGTGQGQSARGRGRGSGRGRGRGRGKGTTPISQSQSSGITIATSMPTNGMTSVLNQQSCVGPNDKGKGIATGDLVPCSGMGSGKGSGRGSSRGGTGKGSSRGTGRASSRGTGRGTPAQVCQYAIIMQMRSTTYGEVYFSRGVGNSTTTAIMDKFHPSQGSSNMPQVNNSNYGSLEGYAPF
ncbi:hypothetical protein RHGRI_012126 [Rhododendron griersonianum]|uniref:PB1-like domain-containing protein n=1 Tax=Rhododendron griersonianum TaxID=479676 RepID=A0AAV6KPY8_9ERIC|nr:hypothetical protein RHGRI_012126 [Rhododendron griersonianum]